MKYLSVKNLHKDFGHKVIFDWLDMNINVGQKVALVAGNWTGKTTLFNILMWETTYPTWEIERLDKINIGMLSQDTIFDEEHMVIDILFSEDSPRAKAIKEYENIISQENLNSKRYDEIVEKIDKLNAWSYESRVRSVISQLKLKEFLNQEIWELSGWEKKRIALAKILIEEPDFLLLDEPTNHLDLQMIEWLENYIKRHDLTLLMVTHDRYFLERVCTDIYELEQWKIYRYPGNYSFFLKKKMEREQKEISDFHNMKQRYRQELNRMRTAPRGRQSKSSDREKKFYAFEKEFKTEMKRLNWKRQGLELSMADRRLWSKIMKISNMKKSFWKKTIVEDFNYEFQQWERVWIIWANGVWKSTFIKMILWEEALDSGNITYGKTVKYWYYTQEHKTFDLEKKVLDVVKDVAEYIKIADGSKLSATKLLERFLFTPKQQHSLVRFLSWGEKRRLSLLLVLLENPNFLILDEPTNDLDIQTIQIVEEFLMSYSGCLIIISHDRFFMDKIVDHLFIFEGNGKISDFWWSYTDYKNIFKDEESKNTETKIEDNQGSENKFFEEKESKKKKKLSYKDQYELDQLLPKIEELEKRKEAINDKFHDTNLNYDDLKKLGEEMKEIVDELEKNENRWLELTDMAW